MEATTFARRKTGSFLLSLQSSAPVSTATATPTRTPTRTPTSTNTPAATNTPTPTSGCDVASMGSITETTSGKGTWTSACFSINRPGRYAKFFSFTVVRGGTHRIDLSSSQDTYMFLLSGNGKTGSVVEYDDDDGHWRDSRIERTLSSGTYTIEATTYSSKRTGSFTLTIVPPDPTPTPTPTATATYTVTATPTLVPTPTRTPRPTRTVTPTPTPASCPSGQTTQPGQPGSGTCPDNSTPYAWCNLEELGDASAFDKDVSAALSSACTPIDVGFQDSYAKTYRFTVSGATQLRLQASHGGAIAIHPVLFLRDDFGNLLESTKDDSSTSPQLAHRLSAGTYVIEITTRQSGQSVTIDVAFDTAKDVDPPVEFRIIYIDNQRVPTPTSEAASTPVPAGTPTPTVTPTATTTPFPKGTEFESFVWKISDQPG